MILKKAPPENAEKLGEVTIDNTARFGSDRINTEKIAAKEVRKTGGNVLRVTKEDYPSPFSWKPYCFLSGDILHVNNPKAVKYDYIQASLLGRWRLDHPDVSSRDFRRFELNIGTGGEAYFASEEFMLGVMGVWYYGSPSISSLYHECYDVNISATVSAEWVYNLNTRWAIVGSFGGCHIAATYYDPFLETATYSETANIYDIMAGVRYRYIYSEYLSLYSQLQLGRTFNTPARYWDLNSLAQNKTAFQVTWLGVNYGKRFYCLCELGWGTEYFAIGIISGMRLGLGYRF